MLLDKEAIDSHQQTTNQKQPQTTTLMYVCVCVDVCLQMPLHAFTPRKVKNQKKGVGGSARARFGAPFKGTQRKVAVFLHETQFPLQDVVLKMVAPDR